jgi:hypothetical protein
MKLRIFAVIALLFASVFPAAAATSVASLNGTYSFQVIGVSQQWGYYSGNNWININGNCPNPQKKGGCVNLSFAKITVGTINFNGKGTAKFLGFKQYGENGGGGPVVGTSYPYKVSGFAGTLTIPGPKGGTVSLSLGSFNSANVATVVQFLIPDNNPSIGTAELQ